jgi:hypothetical protein
MQGQEAGAEGSRDARELRRRTGREAAGTASRSYISGRTPAGKDGAARWGGVQLCALTCAGRRCTKNYARAESARHWTSVQWMDGDLRVEPRSIADHMFGTAQINSPQGYIVMMGLLWT